MADNSDLIRQGYIAERRSLLIISCLIFFYDAAGVKLDTIPFLGIQAKISDPFWIHFGLWTLWVYFLLRYYQYFRDIPDKGFGAEYQKNFNSLVKKAAGERFKHVFDRKKVFPDLTGEQFVCSFVFSRFEPIPDEPHVVRLAVSAKVTLSVKNAGIETTEVSEIIELSRRDLIVPKVQAWVHVIFSTRLATEYVLPFIVSLIPLLYVVQRSVKSLLQY